LGSAHLVVQWHGSTHAQTEAAADVDNLKPMTLYRGDYDQATRYLKYACDLLERQAFGKTTTLREVLQMVMRRLSPGDHYVGDAAAEITVLRQAAEKAPIADARVEILKAIAVLRDRVGR
jgi:hypothetical protein